VKCGITTTLETVRFQRPDRIDFRLVRDPVPHVVESFLLTAGDGGTELRWQGELGTTTATSPTTAATSRLAARRARARTRGGRWVDAAAEARKTACRRRFKAAPETIATHGGRQVDVGAQTRRCDC